MSAIIECRAVSKRFRIPVREHHSLRGRVFHPLTRTRHREFQALDDVSLEVQRGEFFGIVGRNGSGKSTLLKTIAGIYRPDTGSIRVNGSLASFIELGVGFNPELSGHDNLFINGALLGLTRREIQQRYDEIVEFAELSDFMDMKLRNYSSGMQVRLAFSIALQAHADVLLTDEVLAVGDARFQSKCYEVFRQRKREGRTIVFVSHDMGAVEQFCDRALLLEHGQVTMIGDTGRVARQYLHVNTVNHELASTALQVDDDDAPPIEVLEAWLETASGERTGTVEVGEPMRITVRARATSAASRYSIGFDVKDELGQHVLMGNTLLAGERLPDLAEGEEVVVQFELPTYVANGVYVIGTGVTRVLDDETTGLVRHVPNLFTFGCTTKRRSHALIDVPVTARTVRVSAPEPEGEHA